jgi:hypothetical protein
VPAGLPPEVCIAITYKLGAYVIDMIGTSSCTTRGCTVHFTACIEAQVRTRLIVISWWAR